MKKILWCGGSHLANARNKIKDIFCQHENSYLVTAGTFKDDYINGKKCSVFGKKFAIMDCIIDLSLFNLVVFVGQYVQPLRYFRGSMPLSSSLVSAVLDPKYVLLTMRSGQGRNPSNTDWFRNEPLEMIPQNFDGTCYLLPDPVPIDVNWSQVPSAARKLFFDSVTDFCGNNNIICVPQNADTLDVNLVTKKRYSRHAGDLTHMNDEYWELNLNDMLDALACEKKDSLDHVCRSSAERSS